MQESDLWLVFALIVVVGLAVDFSMNRRPHHIPFRTALLQTGAWIAVAVVFGILLFHVTGDSDLTMEYFTAYVIEESMSMDNLFVFIMIFAYFAIPDEDQHEVLFYGVVGAIFFRAIFIFAGVELVSMFDWLLYVFAVILIYAALKGLKGGDDEGDNRIASFMKRRFDYVDADRAGGHLLLKKEDGKGHAVTALLICIIVIELSDLIFALDSIPAVLAISTDTLVIYTSNIFAVMGLRSLFFVIKGGLAKLRYLKYGLAAILLFVALKLLTHEFLEIPIALSLVVILAILAVTVVASLAHKGPDAGGANSN